MENSKVFEMNMLFLSHKLKWISLKKKKIEDRLVEKMVWKRQGCFFIEKLELAENQKQQIF